MNPEFGTTETALYARDFLLREDIAESFLPCFAVRYRPDRISRHLAATISRTIPNRIAYFDSLPFDVYPIESPPRPGIQALTDRRTAASISASCTR